MNVYTFHLPWFAGVWSFSSVAEHGLRPPKPNRWTDSDDTETCRPGGPGGGSRLSVLAGLCGEETFYDPAAEL
nr:hypothetical protein GCM10010200_033220 [Actinomadura rugatobispora]